MDVSFTLDQTSTLIITLLNSIKSKNFEIEMGDDHIRFLRDCIDQKDQEIDALKAKLKATKVTKVTKVTKAPKAPKSSIISKAEAQKISSAIGKRKPGRPKKVAK